MALPIDPETLRIPAFMRKRSLARRSQKSLILTALDRKQAGVLPEGLKPKKKPVRVQKQTAALKGREESYWSSARFATQIAVPFFEEAEVIAPQNVPVQRPRVKQIRRPTAVRRPIIQSFEAPILEAEIKKPKKKAVLGKMTHYYEKIHVGVILLSDTLSVGDSITYPTEAGPYEQVVESMEIERTPVFKATRGEEVGLKLRRVPVIGGKVQHFLE